MIQTQSLQFPLYTTPCSCSKTNHHSYGIGGFALSVQPKGSSTCYLKGFYYKFGHSQEVIWKSVHCNPKNSQIQYYH